MSRIDIVSIGEPMIEFNQTRPGEPNYQQGFGGDTSNITIAAARSGAVTAYVTRIGDDEFGRMFLKLWKDEGVDTRGVSVDHGAYTGAYVVTHGPQGHVFSYLRTGSAASRLQPDDVPAELIKQTRYVIASGISMAISTSAADAVLAAFDLGRASGAKIAFDPNVRAKLWPLARARAMIQAAAGSADFFFPSVEDARALSGAEDTDANLDWAHRLGAKTVFLKMGAKGVIVSDGTRREAYRGLAVTAVDATGAGDCFCGAVLARLAAGDSIWEAARYANVAAALATTWFGAVQPLPRAEAVRRLMPRP
ncbi:MAG: sugar kinase [Candidatus Rokubacteria bacterium]|nr:sugar kinase [Candidatus Rokubacteria bacterium]